MKAALDYYRHSLDLTKLSPDLEDIRQRLGNPVNTPTLYIHGENDGSIGTETIFRMDESYTGTLVKKIVPDAGHFVHGERPDLVNGLIEEYLKE